MKSHDVYEALLAEVSLPLMAEISMRQQQPEVPDIPAAVRQTLAACPAMERIQPGQSVAIAAGSREIHGLALMLRELISAIQARGGSPFIVPAMGSHGSASAEGQENILRHYGVEEAVMGVPVRSCMETVCVGRTAEGLEVHIDRLASQADHIVLVGRVKAHTDFRGKAESGLMKMMAIGLGKQHGAAICHKLGFPRMGHSVWAFGEVILANAPILMGLAVVENAGHRPALIEAVPAERIMEREPELLVYAKSIMPKVPFDDLDVLLISEMGKNISGAGMDPNVTGCASTLGRFWPHTEKIAVLDITPESDGNAVGVGNADAITRRLFMKMDWTSMYVNSITCRETDSAKIPTVMETDTQAVKYCLYCCVRRDATKDPRVVWIRNTANLEKMFISKALLKEAEAHKMIAMVSKPAPIRVDTSGAFVWESK